MTPRLTKRILTISLIVCLLGYAIWFSRNQADHLTAMSKLAEQRTAASEPAEPKQTIEEPTSKVYSKRIVEYHMNVKLEDSPIGKTLQGSQSVTWTNPGKNIVNELYFHLYPNAFASKQSTFIQESGGKLRGDVMKEGSYGSMEITDMQTEEGMSLMKRMQYVQPDDNNPNDRTLMKVRLSQPVKPGQSITLNMKFNVKMPGVFARMGVAGNFVMAGQWFPKLAVYEPAGMRGRTTEGWNIHQYHGNSEFYSDFGTYNVRIQVPEAYKVAASGFPTKSAAQQDGYKTYQYYAEDVHDFAWAASPDFIYAEQPFSAPNVPGVRIKLYLDPAHKDLQERYFHAAKVALARYSEWYGEYPYSTLSIVVPPKEGNGAGGMEYPTLITAFGAMDDNPGYDLERTVVHEIGHQYFYGMLASNEFEEAWLDEGFTSYAEDRVMETEYGIVANLPIESSYMTDPAPLSLFAWKYKDSNQYAENVYTRGKLVLIALEKQVGAKTMAKIMKTYTKKWAFRHPTTSDFQRVVEQVTKKDWTDFFNQYVYKGFMTDYAVESITAKKVDNNGTSAYESKVILRKKGGDYPQVPVVFMFKDGTSVKRTWDGASTTIQYTLTHKTPLDWVMIDPQDTMVLENKRINNYMKAQIDEAVKTRINFSTAKLIESILNALGW
ncbi:M1 family metallopeptidase [Paenibacillus terrigena]|uniref:M1 family metallopeptidase n=1 Tax=Paenibacillus terrigena TaxID=369333 RepID=UPI00037F34AB|nr:M1 family metallopeptidase [Paenibacillus terrigena]